MEALPNLLLQRTQDAQGAQHSGPPLALRLITSALSVPSGDSAYWGVSVAKFRAVSVADFPAIFAQCLPGPLCAGVGELQSVTSVQGRCLECLLVGLESRNAKVRQAVSSAVKNLAGNALFMPGVSGAGLDPWVVVSAVISKEWEALFRAGSGTGEMGGIGRGLWESGAQNVVSNLGFIVAAMQDRLALPQAIFPPKMPKIA